jgi:hypothetical protein
MVAKNQVGFSSTEYLIGKTDGSGRKFFSLNFLFIVFCFLKVPSLIQPKDLIETISNNFINLNMSNWIINQCSILSYEIELFPIRNSTEISLHRYYSFKNHLKNIQIDNLQSNEDYQLHMKVHSQAGEIIKTMSFRTIDDNPSSNSKSQNHYIIILILILSFIFALISLIIIFFSIKFCRLHLTKAGKYKENHLYQINRFLDLFIGQTRKLKPVICSSYPHHYHGTWLKSNNEFTIQNYTDNQIENNIRPYSYASGRFDISFF